MAETVVAHDTVARLLLYRFLAQGYSYPDPAFLSVLAADRVWQELEVASQVLSLSGDADISGLQACVVGYGEDQERLLANLQVEFTYLFISAVPHVPASPYESGYSGLRTLMGEAVSLVLEAYREAGLSMKQDYDAPPDHISAELEFMSYLVQKEAEAEQSADGESSRLWQARQERFLEEHLLRWGPVFLKRVTGSARQPFYRLLAGITEATLRAEAQQPSMTTQG